ncbi:MAG: putative O-glycosylation ligase, exosortase A system-associated [Magnetococcales bacterium]|nr:putative O-glycosylation ligase, exosortase A system-associated [Magnetococcales bacterium]
MRDIVLIVFVFALLPLALFRPLIGLILWAWISYMSPHRLTWGFAYNFRFNFIVAAITIIGILITKKFKFDIPWTNTVKLNFLFTCWTVLTTINAFQSDPAWVQFDKFSKIQIMIFSTLIIVKTRRQITAITMIIAGSIGFYAIKGGIFALRSGGNYRVMGPPQSFIEDNNSFALSLLMIVPLVYFLQLQTKSRMMRLALFGTILLCLLSILATYSRGGLVGLGVLILFFLLHARQRLKILIVLLIIGPIIYQFLPAHWHKRMDNMVRSGISAIEHIKTNYTDYNLPPESAQTIQKMIVTQSTNTSILDLLLQSDNDVSQDKSMAGRLEAWKFCIRVANDRPLLGGGFRTFDQSVYDRYLPGVMRRAPHSIFFEVLAEQGYIGLLIWLTLHISAILTARQVVRMARRNPELLWVRDLGTMLQLSLFAYYTAGLFLGMSTFDLPYHIIALIVILKTYTENHLRQREPAIRQEQQNVWPRKPRLAHIG